MRFRLIVTCMCVFWMVFLSPSHASGQDFCFEAARSFAAGDQPWSVFAADLDGDDDADLAVANLYSDNVSVLKNNGDGTFAAAVNYAVGVSPWSVFAADLDGDDDADLAVANAGIDNVSVLKNNGDGTFAAAVDYAAGDSPRSVFAADMDGDNDADLAVANLFSNNVSVQKNNGNGTFAAAVNYTVGSSPISAFAADLDGDDDADLAVANWESDNVSVLKNNGDGTFAAAVNYAVGDRPRSVIAADLDGDNDADLAVANESSASVSVLKNNGDGTFAAQVFYAAGNGPYSVFAAGLDGDDDADLAVGNVLGDNVSVLENNGDGTYATAVNYAVGDGPQSVFAADLDGDNDADLAVANWGNNVSVLKNCLLPIIVSSLSNSGAGSLRSAIGTANIHPGRDSIAFAIAGTIQPTTPLPYLSDATGGTVIDGLSAPGATPGEPTITLDGSLAGHGSGIEITSSDNTIRGLAIKGFPGAGVALSNPAASQNTVSQNLIYGNGALGIGLSGAAVDIVIDTVFPAGSGSVFHVAGTTAKKATVELFLAERYLGADTVADPSGHGEAWLYLGSDTADDVSGHWIFPEVHSPAWSYFTATATDTLGSTSAFALNRRLIPDSLAITVYSPITLTVIEPDRSDSIGPGFNTIGPTATYDSLTDYGIGPSGTIGEPDDRVTIVSVQPGEYTIRIKANQGSSGEGYFLGIRVDGTSEVYHAVSGVTSTTPITNPLPLPGETVTFAYEPMTAPRGDLDCNGFLDAVDLAVLIDVVFFSGGLPTPPELADINCDGFPDAVDLAVLIDYVFFGGQAPCP